MRKLLVVVWTLCIAVPVVAQVKIDMGPKSPIRKLQMAEFAINNLYVDSVDEHKLVEDAIKGMLEKLDPHSSYSTPAEVKKMNEPLRGNFDGIGVQFNMMDDTLLIIQTITNGPSEKAGVIAGDRIISVNDTVIAGVKMSTDDIMNRLRGPKGTEVKVGIKRIDIAETIYFNIIRDKIPVETIDATYMIRPGIGYIRISSFGANTYKEFMESMEKLRKQGMKDLVLDLQGNGGGYMMSAIDIVNEFLGKGDLIVYTEGMRAPRMEYKAEGNGRFTNGRLVALVDEYSASAAEIVTGAIQDQDRGLVVGRRSFGKGLVQRPIDLPDGSMIRLTVAHYYTPAGRCIQKPYKKGQNKDYAMDVVNRLKHGELTNADSIHFADSLKCYTLREHRVVYGGGGIMPDVFVPLDTTKYTKFHRQIATKTIVRDANLKYVLKNRESLMKQYKTFKKFKAEFTIPQSLLDTVVAEAEKSKIKPKDDEELQKTIKQLSLQMKALVARDLWTMNEYFSVMNEDDDVVMRALELF